MTIRTMGATSTIFLPRLRGAYGSSRTAVRTRGGSAASRQASITSPPRALHPGKPLERASLERGHGERRAARGRPATRGARAPPRPGRPARSSSRAASPPGSSATSTRPMRPPVVHADRRRRSCGRSPTRTRPARAPSRAGALNQATATTRLLGGDRRPVHRAAVDLPVVRRHERRRRTSRRST